VRWRGFCVNQKLENSQSMLSRRRAFFTSMDERIANCGLVLGLGVIAISLFSLLSWCWLPVSALGAGGRVQMTPLSSVAFLFGGASLGLLASYRNRLKADDRIALRFISRVLAAVVILLGFLRLAGYFAHSHRALELLWFDETKAPAATRSRGCPG
jgi:hypothetical protein